MDVTLHSTTKIVVVVVQDQAVPARVWEGTTASGIPVHAYVTRIACDRDADTTEFERELQACSVPSPGIAALPGRLVW
jgi:hypothetical protein